MKKSLGLTLRQQRGQLALSQVELSRRLAKYGVQASNQAISKWEHDMAQPNAEQFLALCRALDIQDVLGAFTDEPTALSGLNKEGQSLAASYIRLLHASGLYAAQPEPIREIRTLPLYEIPASAGTGQLLDSSDYERVEVGDEVPAQADFGVRLSGDSMEPRFHDRQIVWVRQQPLLAPGEIGLFLYRGEAYCKRLQMEDGAPLLCSLNPAYAPIRIGPEEDLRVLGLVLE